MNKIILASSAVVVALTSVSSYAENVVSSASVTVQNALILTEVAGLDFGTIRAMADPLLAGDIATLTIDSDGVTPPATATGGANAVIQSLVDGAPASYTVAGAANFATLTVTLPPAASAIPVSNGAPGGAQFTLDTFEGTLTVANDTGVALTNAAGGVAVVADGSGNLAFNVGAILSTSAVVSTGTYSDSGYTGSYTVDVSY